MRVHAQHEHDSMRSALIFEMVAVWCLQVQPAAHVVSSLWVQETAELGHRADVRHIES
jgi:hypothetical protein